MLLKNKCKALTTTIVIWLAPVSLLLLGCVRAEADPNPTAIPTALAIVAAPTGAPSPTLAPPPTTAVPTPTPLLSATPTPTPAEEREAVAEVPETIDNALLYEGWGTYTDEESGYSLRVPPNWISREFIEADAQNYFKVAFGPADEILGHIGEKEAYKVYDWGCTVVTVSEIPSKFSLEAMINRILFLDHRPALEDAERTDILVGSHKAIQFDESLFRPAPTYPTPQLVGFTTFVKYGDVVFPFTGSSCESEGNQFENLYEMMLRSLEFFEVPKQVPEQPTVDTATWPLYTHPQLGYSLKMHPDFQDMGSSESFLVLTSAYDENGTCRSSRDIETGKWIVAKLDINIFPYGNPNFSSSKQESKQLFEELLAADANTEIVVQDTPILKIANIDLDGRLLPQVIVAGKHLYRNAYSTFYSGEQQAFHFVLKADCSNDLEKYNTLLNAAFSTFHFNSFNP